MKTLYYFLILFLLLSVQSKAGHNMAGCDISYQCTSTPGVYKVTLKFYRDCSSLGAMCAGCNLVVPYGTLSGCNTLTGTVLTTQIVGASAGYMGNNYGSFILNASSGSNGYDIIKTCNSVSTICTNCNTRTAGTYSPGIEVYIYEGNVNLSNIPTACCRVVLGAVTSARFSTNYFYATNFQIVAELDRCQSTCNSAPIFTQDAVALVCSGTDFFYNLGAIDPDGDSLSYAFGASLNGINTPATYVAPFSANSPFSYLGAPNTNAALPAGLHLNPSTGDLQFRPNGAFLSNLVIEVTQWKLVSGVRVNVGMTRRDLKFQSVLCTANKAPIIKVYKNGVLQSGLYFSVCPGQQICLDIVAEDQQDLIVSPPVVADMTELTWNNPASVDSTMASATFVRNYILAYRSFLGPQADSFKLCWTAPLNSIRSSPYTFVVTGTDQNCPVKSTTSCGINIQVVTKPIAIPIILNNNCGNRAFAFSLTNKSLTNLDPTTSKWYVETSLGSNSYDSGSAIFGIYNSYKHHFTQGGFYKWKLALKNQVQVSTGCQSLDSGTIFVNQNEIISVQVKDTISCYGSPIKVNAAAIGVSSIGYQLFSGDLSSKNLIKGDLALNTGISIDSFLSIIPGNDIGLYTYKLKVKDSRGCTDSTSFNIQTRALPIKELTPKIRLCEGSDTSLFAGNNGLNKIWYKAPNLINPIDTQATIHFTNLKTTDSATYVLRKTDSYGCYVLDTTKLFVNKTINFISPKDAACTSNQPFALTARFNTMYIDSFVWFNLGNANRLSSNNSLLLPTNNIGTAFYQLRGYQTYDGVTCFKDDTASLTVKSLPNNVYLTNSLDSFCEGLSSVLNVTTSSSNCSFKWLKNNQIISNEINDSFIVNDAFTYRAIVNFEGCADTSNAKKLTIYQKPAIGNITGNAAPNSLSSTFNYSISSQPNSTYFWLATNGTIQSGQGTNAVNVIWPSAGNGNINAKITNSNGCIDSTVLPIKITNVGINNLSLEKDLKVFPNPSNSFITISNKNNLVGKNYIIENLVGQTVLSGKLNLDETMVNLETLQSGMYFLSLDGMNRQSVKIIKQ
ncbi:MAG: T9SS type A sorting domain-containing protein [Bacteroidia bacterium]